MGCRVLVPRKRIVVLFVVVSLAAAYLGVRVGRVGVEPVPSQPQGPDTLIGFSLPDVDGVLRSSAEWQGRTMLINFWATWCPPCREELPLFVAVQAAYAAQGLQVVGIALDDAERVRAFGDELGLNYPSLIAGQEGFELMNRYGNPGGLPFSVIITRDGAIHSHKLGPYAADELTEALQQVL